MNCNRLDCQNTATSRPALILQPVGRTIEPPPIFELGLAVCDDHKDPDPSKYIHPTEGWTFLDRVFTIVHDDPPDHERVAVGFLPLQ